MNCNEIRELVWQLTDYPDNNLLKKQVIATNLLSYGVEFETKFDTILTEFVTSPDHAGLKKIRHYVVRTSQWLDSSQIILLLANLVIKKQLPQNNAVEILSNFRPDQRLSLNQAELQLIELAEIVFEDLNEGFMDADNDDLFLCKIKAISQHKRKGDIPR